MTAQSAHPNDKRHHKLTGSQADIKAVGLLTNAYQLISLPVTILVGFTLSSTSGLRESAGHGIPGPFSDNVRILWYDDYCKP
jgi:hypothetical protein